jgi:CspA family cold shock protein
MELSSGSGDWASGQVTVWRSEAGWGVIDCAATPGGCWVHFSVVDPGLGELHVGQTVQFTFEQASQDGFAYRATQVGEDLTRDESSNLRSDAYGSALTIHWAEDDEPPQKGS